MIMADLDIEIHGQTDFKNERNDNKYCLIQHLDSSLWSNSIKFELTLFIKSHGEFEI